MGNLSILIVMLAALVIPILMARFKIASMPTAVAEIVSGIILGKSCLNVVSNTTTLNLLANLGVIVLMFLSGMEIDFSLFKPNARSNSHQAGRTSPLLTAGTAFGTVVICAVVLSLILRSLKIFNDPLLSAIIFSTVALGVVIATLKEKEILSQPSGQALLLTAVLGEVIPMIALSVYASINGGNASRLWLMLLLFIAAIFLLYRFRQPYEWFNKITKATTQVDIRLAFFLIFALVTVAETVGAEAILGGFLAGMVMKLLEPSEGTQEKLTSIGYGFFIPIFFIMTGAKLNLRELLVHPRSLALLPALIVAFVLAKLPTWLIYQRSMSNRNALAGSFLEMTTITLVLPALQVATSLHSITNAQASDFVLAAVIVCICGPVLFNSLYTLNQEEIVKQRVVIVGANAISVPVGQDLVDEKRYDVRMVTSNQEAYQTFNSRAPQLTYLPKLTATALTQGGFFDCDIIIFAVRENQGTTDLSIPIAARQHGVERVIVTRRFSNPSSDFRQALTDHHIEFLNSFNVESSVIKNLVESPLLMQMLVDSDAGLFEATLHNQKYAGQELQNLAFIDDVTITRIFRDGHWIVPTGRTVLELGDHILFTGRYQNIASFMDDVALQN